MLRSKIAKGGKIAIPAFFRKQLGLKEGEEILFDLQDHKIVITSIKSTLQTVRDKINQYHPQDESLVDKLIATRREEADHE